MTTGRASEQVWPASLYARYLWLIHGLWEDIYYLIEAHRSAANHRIRTVIARHVLIDLDSLDDLIKEFHAHIKEQELAKLRMEDRQIMENLFTEYHKVLQPSREALKDIRNLGAHRTGKPWKKAPKFGVDPDMWGKWEQLLVSLEAKYDLSQWQHVFTAIVALVNSLANFNLDQWYSISDDGIFHPYMPVLPPGFYPRED